MDIYFIGVDLGTNGIKAGIMDLHGNIVESSYWEVALSSRSPGRTEQNPDGFYEDIFKDNKGGLGEIKN